MDLLCRSDIKTDHLIPNKLPYCRLLGKCTHCPRLNKSGRIISNSTKRKYLIPKKVTCRSNNLIYCIECRDCGIQYVGQTKNELRVHINNHMNTIRNNQDTPVARHCAKHEMQIKPRLIVSILQLIRSSDRPDDSSERNKWENIWIGRLNTVSPNGLNIQD